MSGGLTDEEQDLPEWEISDMMSSVHEMSAAEVDARGEFCDPDENVGAAPADVAVGVPAAETEEKNAEAMNVDQAEESKEQKAGNSDSAQPSTNSFHINPLG